MFNQKREVIIRILLSLLLCFALYGCTLIHSKTIPPEVSEAINAGYLMSLVYKEDPPKNSAELKEYLDVNFKLWEQLKELYSVE